MSLYLSFLSCWRKGRAFVGKKIGAGGCLIKLWLLIPKWYMAKKKDGIAPSLIVFLVSCGEKSYKLTQIFQILFV
jgi:hypothetical protein